MRPMSAPPIIILAEPDPVVSSVLRVEFTGLAFAVLMALTATEVEEYAAATVATLIVMDVGALHMAGFTACARIRHRDGYTNRPIVLTARHVSLRIRAAAEAAGATALLPKPFSVNDLFDAVAPHLPPNDPLLTQRGRGPGAAQEWARSPTPPVQAGRDSALTRNGLLLPIVRGTGVKIPLYRKT
jgi:DNA-binding response OmpR family regulator